VIVAGDFATISGTARSHIARLLGTNGLVDVNFNPGTGTDGSIRALALDSAGRIIIGGDFTSVNAVSETRIARVEFRWLTRLDL